MSSVTRRKLTKKFVEKLTPRKTAYKVWDTELKGFHVEISPNGKIAYYLFYRTVSHRQRRPALGEHSPAFTTENARALAREWMHKAKMGGDPAGERNKLRADITFNQLADLYIEEYVRIYQKPLTQRSTISNIDNHLRKLLGPFKINELTKEDIKAAIDAIRDGKTAVTRKTKKRGKSMVVGGPGAARSAYTHIRHMLMTFAPQKSLLVQPNLFALTPKPETKYSKKGRERFLTEKEYARLGEFIEKCKSRPGIIEISRLDLYKEVWETPRTKLCQKYGISDVALGKLCRKNNIPMPYVGYWERKKVGKYVRKPDLPNHNYAAFQFIEIKNTAFKLYHISPAAIAALELYLYTGCRKSEITNLMIADVDFEQIEIKLRETKTDENVIMPISKHALDTIKAHLEDREKNPHRHVSPDSPYLISGQDGKPLHSVYPAWTKIREHLNINDVTLHDIRRSFGSVGARANMSLLMIGKALAHKSTDATKIYARLSDDATKGAVSLISNKVFELMSGKVANPQEDIGNKDIDMSSLVADAVLKVMQNLQNQNFINQQNTRIH